MGMLTIMKGEISCKGGHDVHETILRLLFTDASHDTSQLRGFASAELESNAQLTMKGTPRMDGHLLITCFYMT